jgi:AcrR family transcriptional regulator
MSPGLRERKKQAAMRRIQEVALDLFDQRGFGNVSIEEIASAADVSPSSVYRYFGTKEQVVLHDEYDLEFMDVIETELASHRPVEAVRRALARVMADYFERDDDLARRKTTYAYEEPALRAATLELTDDFVSMVAEALARATGRSPDDLQIQVTAAALIGAITTAARHWAARHYTTDLQAEMDAALSVLERGLRLE